MTYGILAGQQRDGRHRDNRDRNVGARDQFAATPRQTAGFDEPVMAAGQWGHGEGSVYAATPRQRRGAVLFRDPLQVFVAV